MNQPFIVMGRISDEEDVVRKVWASDEENAERIFTQDLQKTDEYLERLAKLKNEEADDESADMYLAIYIESCVAYADMDDWALGEPLELEEQIKEASAHLLYLQQKLFDQDVPSEDY